MPRPMLLARVRRHRAALPLLVCALYAVFQLAAGPQWTLFPDSYRYARAAEQYLGATRAEAHHAALAAYCASRADRAAHDAGLQPLTRRSEHTVKAAEERECLDRCPGCHKRNPAPILGSTAPDAKP